MRMRHLLTLTVLATFTALGAAVAYLLRDPLPHYLERRSSLALIAESPPTLERGYELRLVRLTATSGLAVELMLRGAVDDSASRPPLVVILGGPHTGRDAVRLLGDTCGTMVWMPRPHVHADTATIRQLADIVLARVRT
jgi:hypothetical protein